jgi:hypothetical protein
VSGRSADELLGRGMGVVSLANLGAKPLGLLAFGPLFTVFDPSVMFLAGGIVVLVLTLTTAAAVDSATRRAQPAQALA